MKMIKPETISNRLAVYRENTSPLIKYYEDRDILVSIDNAGAPEDRSRIICLARSGHSTALKQKK